MKIRSVRPEFFSDPVMAELEPMARLLYIGMWCIADDEGRGEWLPKQIEGQLFPLEDVEIHALLAQLVRTARVVRYQCGDREFFHIPTFERYQKPNRKYPSRIPPPPEQHKPTNGSANAVREQRVGTAHAHAGEGEGEGVVEGDGEVEAVGRGSVRGRDAFQDQKPTDLEWDAAIALAYERDAKNPESLAHHLWSTPDGRQKIRQYAHKITPIDPTMLDVLDGIAKEAS
jgi:hypothetical protein